MSMPFYVSPEQVMKDRADYARKGIARGRSLVALECEPGVLIVADNPSRTLQKISEIYDRIAFAAVGLYSEYQLLRIAGVRHADLKGYSYSREDVSAKELANAYSQTLHQIFTHEMKPYEVELLVAEVGNADDDEAQLYHILYDGVVMDEQNYSVLGGSAEQVTETLKQQYESGLALGDAVRLGAGALSTGAEQLTADQLEVALLERSRPRRAFRRLKESELSELLGASGDAA
jgi:proteasome alpha subunit